MEVAVSFALMNFSLSMFVLAILFFLFDRLIGAFRQQALPGYTMLFRWLALFSLGITGLYAFVMHAFFPDFTASVSGWSNSPFQFEVAVANLGFGLLGVLAFSASYGFRVATVIGNLCWLWGDAVEHIYQMIINHNYAIGNAGSWFWTDILVPLILLICIIKMRKHAA